MGVFDNISEHRIIIGGDWNFVQEVNLDTVGGNPSLKLLSIAEFLKIKSKFDLCDIFRIRNPTTKKIHLLSEKSHFGKEIGLILGFKFSPR